MFRDLANCSKSSVSEGTDHCFKSPQIGKNCIHACCSTLAHDMILLGRAYLRSPTRENLLATRHLRHSERWCGSWPGTRPGWRRVVRGILSEPPVMRGPCIPVHREHGASECGKLTAGAGLENHSGDTILAGRCWIINL